MLNIVRRAVTHEISAALRAAGVQPLLARLYAARGVRTSAEVAYPLSALLPLARLKNAEAAAVLLADAIERRKKLVIVADYDADGATACAIGLRGLRALGAEVDYLVPNRFEFGYGLTPEIVRLAARTRSPQLIITVDNGIASMDGVAEAARLGIEVLVTDHHLPAAQLPSARCIVNPNQPGCDFPSKHLAGVGVMFYVLAALRAELRRRGAFATNAEPKLAGLLDLVALGTVADVVALDTNNRILVHQGLQRIRQGRGCAGIRALYRVAGRDCSRACAYDLGFLLGPRLNAAGRLTDMSLGIECLATDDEARAAAIARQLDQLNRERRDIESEMHASALDALAVAEVGSHFSLCLYRDDWHQGVVGILASRLKERFHRPAIAFARGQDGMLKGSGRSIAGLHLRDALDLVAKRSPDLIVRFGGHAAAAGLTIDAADFARFATAFETVCRELLSPDDLAAAIQTDGALAAEELALDSALAVQQEVWGQGFAPPLFDGEFRLREQRVVAEKHSRLVLDCDGRPIEAVLFGHAEPLPARLRAIYRLGLDDYGGARRLQLTIERWESAP
ncbi:MAG: single-stranded-DNA-specific exonuclease RecJ [Burkholderiales bacterium]|nr:single-stranded-DNA-specific exonuclease RecJ [Burkholderiales bacterium]